MRFYRHFLACTYGMIFLGALSLAFSEASPVYFAITWIGLGFGWLLARHGRDSILTPRAQYGLFGAAVLFMIADYLVISQAMPLAFAHILVFIQLIKVFSPKKDRDYLQIYAISFMHLALSSIMTVDLLFALFFVLYMVLSTWALTLFHLKRGAERFLIRRELTFEEKFNGRDSADPRTRHIRFGGRGFYLASCVSVVITLACTIALFSLIPRVSTRFFALKYSGGSVSVSGFSEEVSFGQIGAIKLDATPVMTLKFVTLPPHEQSLYLRGLTYSTFDGTRWTNTLREPDIPCLQRQATYFRVHAESRRFETADAGRFSYRIAMQPQDTHALFHISPAESIEFSVNPPQSLRFNPSDEVLSYSGGERRDELRYEVVSIAMDTRPERLRLASSHIRDARLHKRYTQLHEERSAEMQRIRSFAAETVARAGAQNDYDRVRALEERLSTEFSYTLEQHPTPGMDPVYDFLFTLKQGHCEYFASALVVLCRTLDIPARLVGGYREGTYNDIGEFYQITKADAHAWMEVHFDGIGWVAFDATPGDPRPQSMLTGMRNWLSYMRYAWDEFVIDYGWKKQRKVLMYLKEKTEALRRTFESLPGKMSQWTAAGKNFLINHWILLAMFAAGAWLLIAAVSRRLREYLRNRQLRARARINQQLLTFYRRLLQALERRGFRKSDFETPREFAGRVIDTGGVFFTSVNTLVHTYYRIRYGREELTDADRVTIERILEEMDRLGEDPDAGRTDRLPRAARPSA